MTQPRHFEMARRWQKVRHNLQLPPIGAKETKGGDRILINWGFTTAIAAYIDLERDIDPDSAFDREKFYTIIYSDNPI